ncbi:MAG: hypothetical protein JXR97_00645, partial [Planctomycetes bacterium]|nr:hypothetical protein [Planctomycetota bacterium]
PHVYFDMGNTFDDKWFVNTPGGSFDMFVIRGPEFSDIVGQFTDMVGRMPVLEKWMHGFWCSSIGFETTGQVVSTVKQLRDEGYPCDAVVIDGTWRGGPNFLKQYTAGHEYPANDVQWHDEFGDGADMVDELLKMNVKTCLHVNSRTFADKTIEENVPKGLLRRQKGEVVPRFTYEEAEQFYRDMLTPRIREGVASWWTDHSDRVSGEIRPGMPSRNLFGPLWNKHIQETMEGEGHKPSLCLSRGGGIGSQKYALPWPGDTRVGIDGFAEDIWFMLNAGLTGFPLTSADLGGFTLRKDPNTDYASQEEKDAEVFDEDNICRRVCQCLLFTPTPRIHNNWDAKARLPWNCSEEAQKLYHATIKKRYELTPYVYSYSINAAKTGEPILRPMVYHHRNDANTYALGDQFYMGEWMILAPVTEAQAKTRTVYLPEGKWIDFWSGKEYQGEKKVEMAAPMYAVEGLPVFIKAGAIIPTQKFKKFMDQDFPEELTLNIYPEGDSRIVLNESESVSNTFASSYHEGKLELELENNTGKDRVYIVQLPEYAKVESMSINGEEISRDKWKGERTVRYEAPCADPVMS